MFPLLKNSNMTYTPREKSPSQYNKAVYSVSTYSIWSPEALPPAFPRYTLPSLHSHFSLAKGSPWIEVPTTLVGSYKWYDVVSKFLEP